MVGEAEGGEIGFSRWERATERLLADNGVRLSLAHHHLL
eukprot:COSAG04_NODE_2621_length_3843_cov_1.524038_5_plen_38_part_01